MKNKLLVLITIACMGLCACTVTAAPTIDGSLADWGLGKLITDPWSENSAWVPNDGITYIVEDNQDPLLGGTGYTGVHITGIGPSYTVYHEQKVQDLSGNWVIEPVGGEPFDMEAIYMQQDPANLYLGVVTSVSPDETGGLRPGDLALNIDHDATTGENGYEYGIVMGKNPYPTGLNQGDIVYLPDWESTGAVNPQGRPDVIIGFLPGGGVVGNLGSDLVYDDSWMTVIDHDVKNYVVEAKIPKAEIGASDKYLSMSDLFYADNCLNDTLYVPEFPTIAVSIGTILGIMFLAINRQNKN
jgi:hypothetical protein